MAVRQEIQITITPDGEVKLTVVGVSGEACLDLTQALEDELGVVVGREKTSEFYHAEVNTEDQVKIGEE